MNSGAGVRNDATAGSHGLLERLRASRLKRRPPPIQEGGAPTLPGESKY